jgi:hypothetical protein
MSGVTSEKNEAIQSQTFRLSGRMPRPASAGGHEPHHREKNEATSSTLVYQGPCISPFVRLNW